MSKSQELPTDKSMAEQQREESKKLIILQLKKTPIVQVACEKLGIARANFYRWKKDDKEFGEKVDEALLDGNHLVNDMAESQLMAAIRDKNMTAIIFWLKHHHPAYETRVKVDARLRSIPEELTPEQAEQVLQALQLAGITKNITNETL